jgi:hypothetical protein
MRKLLASLMLSGVLMAPAIMSAKDHVTVRFYDRNHRDYHNWNGDEERAYRHWVEQERHQTYKEWKHAKKRDQQEYWRWRHDHMDWR